MFNQTQPRRSAVAWQPQSTLALKLSERGYGTTQWTTEEADDFATLGYPAKTTGFSADHYQPMTQPLSKQALASLALLEDEYRNETLGEEKPESVESTSTNAHLPFVMDDFAATRKSKLRVKVDPAVLKRAQAHADLAETLVVSPITSADENARDTVVLIEDTHRDTSEELAQELRPEAEPEVEPELPAVVGGVPPEEVAQREAQQFAKGLAQGREEGAAQALEKGLAQVKAEALEEGLKQGREQGLAEGLEKGLAQGEEQGKAQGFEEGLAQGKAEGLAEGLAQGLAQSREEAKQEGIAIGEQQAREAMAAEMAAQRAFFESASKELNALLGDSKKLYEPLKRLAVHVAEQLVMGELTTSSKAIERLVQRCLDELDHPAQGAVVLELNPEDKVRLQEQGAEFTKGMRLEPVHTLPQGSVRLYANDTVIEDLVTHRLEGLVRSIAIDEDKWREKSTLVKTDDEMKEEGGDVHS